MARIDKFISNCRILILGSSADCFEGSKVQSFRSLKIFNAEALKFEYRMPFETVKKTCFEQFKTY